MTSKMNLGPTLLLISPQAAWRAYRARQQLQRERAAVCVQAVWRGHVVRAQQQRKRAAAISIQVSGCGFRRVLIVG